MTIRVVEWTTGQVARAAVRAVLAQQELELVGCYAWSPRKVGKDVGELCELPPLGVTATDDIEAIIALNPDVVLYMPMLPDIDVWCVFSRPASTSFRLRASSPATALATTP